MPRANAPWREPGAFATWETTAFVFFPSVNAASAPTPGLVDASGAPVPGLTGVKGLKGAAYAGKVAEHQAQVQVALFGLLAQALAKYEVGKFGPPQARHLVLADGSVLPLDEAAAAQPKLAALMAQNQGWAAAAALDFGDFKATPLLAKKANPSPDDIRRCRSVNMDVVGSTLASALSMASFLYVFADRAKDTPGDDGTPQLRFVVRSYAKGKRGRDDQLVECRPETRDEAFVPLMLSRADRAARTAS